MTLCPACGGQTLTPLGTEADLARGGAGRFATGACCQCGHQVLQPIPLVDELAAQYDQTFYGAPGAAGSLALRLFMAARCAQVARLTPPPGPVLDVGCGEGSFLRALAARGYRVAGQEPSAAGRQRAAGVADVVARVEDIRGGPYSVITLWQVLEHVPDPLQMLTGLKGHLAAGGVLLVSVPNAQSAEARLFGPHWFHRDVPRHVHHFSPASLRALLGRAGLHVQNWRWRSAEYNLFGALQSAHNALPVEHNALYKVLKQGRAVGALDPASRTLVRVTLASLPLWVAGAVGWDLAQAFMGSGATMTVVAAPTGQR